MSKEKEGGALVTLMDFASVPEHEEQDPIPVYIARYEMLTAVTLVVQWPNGECLNLLVGNEGMLTIGNDERRQTFGHFKELLASLTTAEEDDAMIEAELVTQQQEGERDVEGGDDHAGRSPH